MWVGHEGKNILWQHGWSGYVRVGVLMAENRPDFQSDLRLSFDGRHGRQKVTCCLMLDQSFRSHGRQRGREEASRWEGLLEELALTDALTGLPNRRAVEAWAERQLAGAARHGFSFWVVMADLDHFKSVNDTCGHEAGDAVLKRFAQILKTHTRSSNICSRLGGEEFLLVLTHAEKANVEAAINRIREQLEAQAFRFGDASLRVNVVSAFQAFRQDRRPILPF